MTNRQIVLDRLPQGDRLTPEHFALNQGERPSPREGEVLLKTRYISLDAANRAWMQGATYRSALNAGQVMAGGGLSELQALSGDASTFGTALSIDQIDTMIENVSEKRSDFGAVQNRLEHRLNNLATYQENLVASESRIRDVDMASEMVNFTKLGILQQAGTSMLAQANQAPQSVLSLLR